MVVYTFNPSTQKAEADRSHWVSGQPGLHDEFQDNQDYIVRPCLIFSNMRKLDWKVANDLERSHSRIGTRDENQGPWQSLLMMAATGKEKALLFTSTSGGGTFPSSCLSFRIHSPSLFFTIVCVVTGTKLYSRVIYQAWHNTAAECPCEARSETVWENKGFTRAMWYVSHFTTHCRSYLRAETPKSSVVMP